MKGDITDEELTYTGPRTSFGFLLVRGLTAVQLDSPDYY